VKCHPATPGLREGMERCDCYCNDCKSISLIQGSRMQAALAVRRLAVHSEAACADLNLLSGRPSGGETSMSLYVVHMSLIERQSV